MKETLELNKNTVLPASGRILPTKIFIVGTGRSGTHWLGRSLIDSGFSSSMEKYLSLSVDIVLFGKNYLWKNLIDDHHKDKCIVDKSHVLLWEVERLAKEFPTALFIGIKRDKDDTIASMLKHPGVRRWCTDFKSLNIPFPNRMLGCNSQDEYEKMTLHQRCFLRWKAHMDEINRLERVMSSDRWITVDYDKLEEYAIKLTEFLGTKDLIRIKPRHVK